MKRMKPDDLNKKVPFRVPEGYFDQLTVSIQSKIKEEPKHAWLPSPRIQWALASSAVLLIVAFIWLFNSPNNSTSPEQMLADVNEQALIEYLDFADLSEDDLFEGLSDENLEQLWGDDDTLNELELESGDLDEILTEYENETNLL